MQDQSTQTPDISPVTAPDVPYTPSNGAPADIVRTPSLPLTIENSAYGVLPEGPTAKYIVDPFYSWLDNQTGDDRHLSQPQVDKLLSDNGIVDQKIDASKYNLDAVSYLLARAQRRKAMDDINQMTSPSIIGSGVRFATSTIVGLLDPLNALATAIPSAKLAQFVGMEGLSAGIRALEDTAATGATLGARVGARAATGFVQGAVGQIPLVGIGDIAQNYLQEDYNATSNLIDIGMGGIMGGGLHMILGGLSKSLPIENDNNVNQEQNNNNVSSEPSLSTTENNNSNLNPELTNNNLDLPQQFNENINNTDDYNAINNKIQLASEKFNNVNGNIVSPDLGIDNDLQSALNKNNPEYKTEDNNILANQLSDFISKKTTTPEMVSDVYNKYNDKIKNLVLQEGEKEDTQLSNIDKEKVLSDAINSTVKNPTKVNIPDNNYSINNKVLEASNDFKSLDDNFSSEFYHDKNVLSPTEGLDDDLKTAVEMSNPDYVPTEENNNNYMASRLAQFLEKKTTTPRMISDVYNKYHENLIKAINDEPFNVDRQQILQNAITSTSPTVAEMANAATSETRQSVLNASIAQVEQDKYPLIDSLLKSDPNINEANLDDVISEIKQINNPENSFITENVPPKPIVDNNIPYEQDKINYRSEIEKLDNKISELEELDRNQLYSTTPSPSTYGGTIDDLKNEIIKQFGNDGQKLLDDNRVEIVNTAKDLPFKLREGEGDVKGVNISTGKTYLIADKLMPEQIRGVMLHEVGEHANMENFLGEKTYSNVINNMNTLLENNRDLNDIIKANVPENTPQENIQKERLGYLIENAPSLSVVQKVFSKIKTYMYRKYPSLQKYLSLDQNDLATIALASLKHYTKESNIHLTDNNYHLYSTSEEDTDRVQQELDFINNSIEKAKTYNDTMNSISDQLLNNINDKKSFVELMRNSISGITKDEGNNLYSMFNNEYSRAIDEGTTNPVSSAITQVTDQLEHAWKSRKFGLLDGKIKVTKKIKYLVNSWTSNPKAGTESILAGTSYQAKGARAHCLASEIVLAKLRHMSNFQKVLIDNDLQKLFVSGAMSDDIMRAKYAIENNNMEKLAQLPPEAKIIAKAMSDTYDAQITDMNDNGLIINRQNGYYGNQKYMHDQGRIKADGSDNWISTVKRSLNLKQTARAMGISIKEMNNEFWQDLYRRMSTGEHYDIPGQEENEQGSYSGNYSNGQMFKKVNNQQRKLIFNDDEAAIEYFNKYGTGDLAHMVMGTIDQNSKKIGILKGFGAEYEKNAYMIAKKFSDKIPDMNTRIDYKKTYRQTIEQSLKSIDGRADVPGNEMAARALGNVRAGLSMAMLSKAAVAGAINDPLIAAKYITKKSGSKFGILGNYFKAFTNMLTPYSKENKSMLTSFGVSTDNVLKNAYRFGAYENSVSKSMAKASNWFYSYNGIHKQGDAMKMAAMDMAASFHAGIKDLSYNELNDSVRHGMGLHEITSQDWDIWRKTQTLAIDGKNYLDPNAVRQMKPQIKEMINREGLSEDTLNAATDRYARNLQQKLLGYYQDWVSNMYMEGDAASKMIARQGVTPGTLGDAAMGSIMQFKQYAIQFIRKVWLNDIREDQAIYGHYTLNSLSNMAQFLGAGVALGYVTDSVYQLLDGKDPRSWYDENGKFNIATLMTSLLKSGGLGVFGDYLFSDFNSFGSSVGETIGGPLVSVLGSGLRIGTALRDDALGEKGDAEAKTIRFVKSTLPNLFYTNLAMNYLFANELQERLNPGYLERMENHVRQQGQDYWLPPTSRLQW